MYRQTRVLTAAGTSPIAVAACSGSESVPAAAPGTAPSTLAPAIPHPETAKALNTYEAHLRARNKALETPVAQERPHPSGSDLTRWAYDPAEADTSLYDHALATRAAEYRGRAAISHITLSEVDLEAFPYPQIELIDCQVPQGPYMPYGRDTDEPVPFGDVNLKDPYPVSVEMISVKGRWGVTSVEADRQKSCEA